jgi:hypothetical protein
MKPAILLFFTVLLIAVNAICQTIPEVIPPPFNDKYSQTVKKLEAGQKDINFTEFRESFIESKQFLEATKKKSVFDSLEREMYAQMKSSNSQAVIRITKAMLSIDYTSMIAHKILRQTYKIIGDTVNANKYHDIQFGLLHSIADNGNGKTCETGWPVIQISEEYFMLRMIDATLISQSLEDHCDKMNVKVDGVAKTYYFDITSVIHGYKKLGLE